MYITKTFLIVAGILASFFRVDLLFADQPDSVYLFSYASEKNMGKNGLHFAWSIDGKNFHPVGPEYSFVRCDYGQWGAEKRMLAPYLFPGRDGLWHCLWSLNETAGAFAHAASEDLIRWKRQSYPVISTGKNCLQINVSYDTGNNGYVITWTSRQGDHQEAYMATTRDFKSYSPAKSISAGDVKEKRQSVKISGKTEKGVLNRVPWKTVDGLIQAYKIAEYEKLLYSETTKDDPVRFASLQPVEARIDVDAVKSKKISDMLMGIFFEDINYAADGGLYAELVQNRGFEYSPGDKDWRDKSWNSRKAWSLNGNDISFGIDSVAPIHENNKHYAVLQVNKVGAGLVNEGFDGIPVKAGERYIFSVFARTPDGKNTSLKIRLTGKNGEISGETNIKTGSKKWKKYRAVLTAKSTVADARLEIIPQSTGTIALDMISLFPEKTFKNRENGLRADLAQTLADLHPRFVRFPGGCVAHGDGLGNIYHWKNTIGPPETRKPQRNLWGYHQSAGLGYFEYFQFCEDIGAEPVPIVAAGVPCQNSHTGGGGQQGGIPMCEMDHYVQDVLDLIEYANGSTKTAWGKKRAEAGHPQPFNLKYIGVGNEDLITDVFEERFTMIYNAVKEKHPEITVIGTVGPFHKGTDYDEGWDLATRLQLPMVDEHYYEQPGWFIYNQDFYDRYDRSKSKVYLGEYAAHLPGRPNNLETALAEALYLTSLERNGDIVSMTSYAPLLAKEGHTQWNPDLIYFNNTEVKPTVGYYVQQLFGLHPGDEYVPGNIWLSNNRDAVRKRVAVSVVKIAGTDEYAVKLVNMLPVTVRSEIVLSGIPNVVPEAEKTVMQGNPSDKTVKPETSGCTVAQTFDYTMPAYSFTVIRIKTWKDEN